MKIEIRTEQEKPILILIGSLDTTSAPLLEKRLQAFMEEGKDHLLLDFTLVDYLSSAGLRVLFSFSQKLEKKKGKLVLFSLSDEVMQVIRMAGFQSRLKIAQNEAQALQK